MVLVQKWSFFQLFFLGNVGHGNVFYDILERKNAFLGYKNKKFKNTKNCHFSNFNFLGNTGQENVFYDILERRNAFLGYKNRKFKSLKKWHFSKGVIPWFWSENGNFSNFFFFCNVGQESVFYGILERKNAFLGDKNKKIKRFDTWHFSMVLVQKWPFFQFFF